MPFAAGGVVILLQVLCLIHAVRTGRTQPWAYILVLLPVAGGIAYLVAELLPEWTRGPQAQRARQTLAKTLDPERDYRQAKELADETPTPRNLLALAAAGLELGRGEEAAALYRRCLVGHDVDDPALLLGLARAELLAGRPAETLAALDRLRRAHPDWQSSEGHLLYARALETLGELDRALVEHAALAEYFPGPEAAVRQAELLERVGRAGEAATLWQSLRKRYERAPRHLRRRYKSWWDRVLAKG